MRLAVLSAAIVVATAVPSTAAVEPAQGPAGRPCGWSSDFGPGIPESEHGVVYGGPFLATGTLTCTMLRGGTTHSGPADASVAYSATGTAVTYLAPTPFYFSGNGAVVVCTSFQEPGGPVLYWEPALAGGHWTTDATASCVPPDLLPEGFPWSVVDPVICAALVAARGPFSDPAGPLYIEPGGDTYLAGELLWDCPPYGAP
jgi:hypothetical protein